MLQQPYPKEKVGESVCELPLIIAFLAKIIHVFTALTACPLDMGTKWGEIQLKSEILNKIDANAG